MSYDYNYFYKHGSPQWLVSAMPDPHDGDPIRYAILASLVETIADAVKFRMELGIPRDRKAIRNWDKVIKPRPDKDSAPAWPENVPGIPGQGVNLIMGEAISEFSHFPLPLDKNFMKRNIKATLGYLFTL